MISFQALLSDIIGYYRVHWFMSDLAQRGSFTCLTCSDGQLTKKLIKL